MKTCVGDLEAAVKEGNQEKVEVAKQRLLAEGKLTLEKSFASYLVWFSNICTIPQLMPFLRQGPRV